MKLTQDQIHQIELHLESKELYQIDLKQEVLDHIANAVEERMEQGTSFINAFDLEQRNWKTELEKSQNGYFSGPKVMINKSFQILKNSNMMILGFSVFITFLIFVLNRFHSIVTYETKITTLLGMCFFVFIGLILIFWLIMRSSKIKSTYRYLFRNCAIVMLILCVFSNPLWDSENIIKNDEVSYFSIFFFTFILASFYPIVYLFYKHLKAVKQQIV